MGEGADDGGEQVFEDLRALGVSEAEIAQLKAEQQRDARSNVIEVEPENRGAVRIFLRAMSQWRGEAIVAGRHLLVMRSGLDYTVLPAIAQILNVELDEQTFDGVRVMEAEALTIHIRRQEEVLRRR